MQHIQSDASSLGCSNSFTNPGSDTSPFGCAFIRTKRCTYTVSDAFPKFCTHTVTHCLAHACANSCANNCAKFGAHRFSNTFPDSFTYECSNIRTNCCADCCTHTSTHTSTHFIPYPNSHSFAYFCTIKWSVTFSKCYSITLPNTNTHSCADT